MVDAVCCILLKIKNDIQFEYKLAYKRLYILMFTEIARFPSARHKTRYDDFWVFLRMWK